MSVRLVAAQKLSLTRFLADVGSATDVKAREGRIIQKLERRRKKAGWRRSSTRHGGESLQAVQRANKL